MSQPIIGTATPMSSRKPFIRLAERQHIAPQVRPILEALLERGTVFFEKALAATFKAVEDDIFKRAESAQNNQLQQQLFEAMQEIKTGGLKVKSHILRYLESDLASLDELCKTKSFSSSADTAGTSGGKLELSLVDSTELEERLAVEEIASKADSRHSQVLYALGHRLAALADGGTAFTAETVPFGPTRIAEALRQGIQSVNVETEYRIMLYRTFDRVAMIQIGSLYDGLNRYLIEKGILPNSILQTPRAKSATGTTHPTPSEQPPNEPNQSFIPEPAAYNGGSFGENASADAGVRTTGNFALPQIGNTPASHPNEPLPTTGGTARHTGNFRLPSLEQTPPFSNAQQVSPTESLDSSSNERDVDTFTTLRKLLAGRRRQIQGGASLSEKNYYPANNTDLQSILGNLQNKPITPIITGGKVTQREVSHLKQDILSQLNQLNTDGRPPRLAEEDSDTIDLVDMLFEYVGKTFRAQSDAQTLLTKLQVPVLRTALQDKTFFTRHDHPARRLLNTIAETSSQWADEDDPTSHPFAEKVQGIVDRVSSQFTGDVGLFEDLTGELTQYTTQLTKRAAVTERRYIEAAKGREKLDIARDHARSAVKQLLNKTNSSTLLRTLLEQAWTDVLALTILQQGQGSDAYQRRIDIADKLLHHENTENTPIDATLRQEVETGLTQVGVHQNDAQAVVDKILHKPTTAAETDEHAISQTELTLKLKNRARLGEDSNASATSSRAESPNEPLNAEEQHMLEHIKTVPFGTWFEFTTTSQGMSVRRKLAWFSTVTGRCLFVNQRGARTDERSMDQLARELVSGKIRAIEAEKESLIDRALKNVFSALKQFTGISGSAPA